ncbi:MAG: hypothetical protein ACXWXA_09790 [Candidatus Limnocylindrales bacterium]
MSADVLTTWGVVLTLDGIVTEERLESASHWFAQGRHAFFELCPRLAAFLRAEKGALRVTVEQIEPIEAACWAGGLTIGASVVEVRPSSFDMAVRIRPAIDDANRAANGRCTMVIERRATGERIPISREIREEFIAIQLAARELC